MYRNYYFCNRYRNGIRGHMKAVVLSLLRQYLQHEVLFNEGINKLIYNSKRKVISFVNIHLQLSAFIQNVPYHFHSFW